jgi:uncharacterized protein (DUF952 family)
MKIGDNFAPDSNDFRPAMTLVYKICPRPLWEEAERDGVFRGAPVDRADGYIHFSTADQMRQTAAKHFAGQADLVLVTVEVQALGPALKWEPSRGGALFPHLYADLPLRHVRSVEPLPLGSDGVHQFPSLGQGTG